MNPGKLGLIGEIMALQKVERFARHCETCPKIVPARVHNTCRDAF